MSAKQDRKRKPKITALMRGYMGPPVVTESQQNFLQPVAP